jgi:hypothetical protein
MTEAQDYPPAVRRWHEIAAARDPAGLDDLLVDEIVFVSPVVHTPQRGKPIAKAYLAAALEVLGAENFRYVGFWRAETSAVLEFVTVIDGVEVNGVDIIGWNAEDRIVSFKVMARPLKGIEVLRAKMAARLEAMRP